jgi:hypothetical protein
MSPAGSGPTRLAPGATLDARAKLGRAAEHIDALDGEIAAFLDAHVYAVSVERQPDQPRYVCKANRPPDAPVAGWGLLAGEAIHALRCALNYVTWQLAGCPTDDRLVQFPLRTTREAFTKEAQQRLKAVRPDAQAFLEGLQPYTYPGCDLWLAQLIAFDNADKHRLLTMTAVARGKITVHFEGYGNDIVTCESRVDFVDNAVLDDGAVLATLTVPDDYPEMDVQATVTGDVAFRECLDRPVVMYVRPVLRAMVQQVEEIIVDCERRFVVR